MLLVNCCILSPELLTVRSLIHLFKPNPNKPSQVFHPHAKIILIPPAHRRFKYSLSCSIDNAGFFR